ncbi:AAA family ATPase [Sphingobacterium sp. SYP-B4668]|uniref:AAA family ATPase n=1 Tax=Sphingobacterium sp. SYP-B4668 TaxID=2996035 RepID=UPI0022DD93C2|nr:AAA family ATPase [Sphingobacterium sp. SYP-B4668]
MLKSNFYVVTGGPGAGKTTLLEGLACTGLKVVPEDARRIIKEQISIGGDGLPWANKIIYTDLMLKTSIETYEVQARKAQEVYVFDRGILDAICYAEMTGQGVTHEMELAAQQYRYNVTVFMLPPWQEIYETDNERLQSWSEAVHTYKTMKEIYLRYGYQIVEVPKATVPERVDFVLQHLGLICC